MYMLPGAAVLLEGEKVVESIDLLVNPADDSKDEGILAPDNPALEAMGEQKGKLGAVRGVMTTGNALELDDVPRLCADAVQGARADRAVRVDLRHRPARGGRAAKLHEGLGAGPHLGELRRAPVRPTC
jgi:hypothetical protein